jgi:hypothetical protein
LKPIQSIVPKDEIPITAIENLQLPGGNIYAAGFANG